MLDLQVCEFRNQSWDDHLDRLRGKKYAPAVEYAASVDLCAASRILDGSIEVYSSDQVAGVKMIRDERAENDVKKVVAWVHTSDKGRLNHFELWLTAEQVNDREAARQQIMQNITNSQREKVLAESEIMEQPEAIEGAE